LDFDPQRSHNSSHNKTLITKTMDLADRQYNTIQYNIGLMNGMSERMPLTKIDKLV